MRISGQHVPLDFEAPNDPNARTKDAFIEPGAAFVLIGAVPSSPHAHGGLGYSSAQYLEKFGGFEFVFQADDVRFSHKFSYSQVREMIKALEDRYGPKPPPPTVKKRP